MSHLTPQDVTDIRSVLLAEHPEDDLWVQANSAERRERVEAGHFSSRDLAWYLALLDAGTQEMPWLLRLLFALPMRGSRRRVEAEARRLKGLGQ